MSSPLHRSRAGSSLGLLAILAVAGAIAAPGAQAIAGGASASTPATTPTFPVPASAKVPPGSTATTPTTPATGGTVTPPTTTYTPQSTTPTGSVATTTPTGRTITTPTSAHATKSSKLSTPAIALAILGALVVLLCLAWAIARAQAYEPHWVRSLRHSLAEGGFRASATWAEFGDWARLGK